MARRSAIPQENSVSSRFNSFKGKYDEDVVGELAGDMGYEEEYEDGQDALAVGADLLAIASAKGGVAGKMKAAGRMAKKRMIATARASVKEAVTERLNEEMGDGGDLEEVGDFMDEAEAQMDEAAAALEDTGLGDMIPSAGLARDLMANRGNCCKVLCIRAVVWCGWECFHECISECTQGYCELPCCDCFWDWAERSFKNHVNHMLMKAMGLNVPPPDPHEGFKRVRYCGWKSYIKVFSNPLVICWPVDRKWVPETEEAQRKWDDEHNNSEKYCGKKSKLCCCLCPCFYMLLCCCCKCKLDTRRTDGKASHFCRTAIATRQKARGPGMPIPQMQMAAPTVDARPRRAEKGISMDRIGEMVSTAGEMVEKGIELGAVVVEMETRTE